MKSNKELNKAVASILGEPEIYDVRKNLRLTWPSGFTKEVADERVKELISLGANPDALTITSTPAEDYVGDVKLALYAAQRIAERNQCTFVLSLEDGVWKAAFGNWGDCSEYKGGNPAYAACVSMLKFMGKL